MTRLLWNISLTIMLLGAGAPSLAQNLNYRDQLIEIAETASSFDLVDAMTTAGLLNDDRKREQAIFFLQSDGALRGVIGGLAADHPASSGSSV